MVEGAAKLSGSVDLQGSKNAMLINLVLPILTADECRISNVPRIGDVELNLSILQSLGAKVKWLGKQTVSLRCDKLSTGAIDPRLAKKTSSSKFFIPLLVKRFGQVITGPSLGDDIGLDRGFSQFTKLMEFMGISYRKEGSHYLFYSVPVKEKQSRVTLTFPSFSATVGAVLANVLGEGQTRIFNVHRAPEIENAFEMLNRMGAKIAFDETSVDVQGVKGLHGTNFENLSDRNALVTFAAASLITDGEVTIRSRSEFGKLKVDSFWEFLRKIKSNFEVKERQLTLFPSLSNLVATEVYAYMWPHFHSDWQPLVAPLLTQIGGTSSIVDDLFESRFGYWTELGKLGASYELFVPENSRFKDGKPHGVKIYGPSRLCGSAVMAPDVRGGASLVIAGLSAQGKTIIENVGQIERGYEDLVGVLSSLGAKIGYED